MGGGLRLLVVALAGAMALQAAPALAEDDVPEVRDPEWRETDVTAVDAYVIVDGEGNATDVDGNAVNPEDVEDVNAAVFGVILNIEATILDVGSGTANTESADEVTVTLDADVFFDFDEFELRSDALSTLLEVAEQIRGEGGVTELHIDGHTDSVGGDAYNQRLSEQRAEAVAAFLADELDGVSMTTEGHGASQPVAPNETEAGEDNPEGRALNRRVEITYPH